MPFVSHIDQSSTQVFHSPVSHALQECTLRLDNHPKQCTLVLLSLHELCGLARLLLRDRQENVSAGQMLDLISSNPPSFGSGGWIAAQPVTCTMSYMNRHSHLTILPANVPLSSSSCISPAACSAVRFVIVKRSLLSAMYLN